MMGHSMRPLLRVAGALWVLALCALTTERTIASDRSEDPPRLLFAERPAILVLIDGDPVYRPVDGTDLQRIVNTKPFIVRDAAGIHYMKVYDGWMEAYSLTSLWSVAGVPPRGAKQALQRALLGQTGDLLDGAASRTAGRTVKLDDATAPEIIISTEPAELIVTDGPPRFVKIEGTALEYVENTAANVFKEPTDEELYVLISGRWFRAWTTDGPWEVVPPSDLPSDILAIPDTSPVWHGTRAGRALPRR
jgi:hypothetical protein